MNKFITDIYGKQPVFLNNFRFIDTALRKAFASIITAITHGENRILFGCELSSPSAGNYDVTAGAVAIQGEVLTVAAQSFACANINDCYYHLHEYDATEGLRVFGDGTSHHVYKMREAAVIETATPDAALTCTVTSVPISRKKHEPIGSSESADEYFVTESYLGRTANSFNETFFSPEIGSYETMSGTYLKHIRNGNSQIVNCKLEVLIPSGTINEFRFDLSEQFIFSSEIHIVALNSNEAAILEYIAPATIKLRKLDGSDFSGINTFYFNIFSIF